MNLAINIDLEAAIAAALSPERLAPILDKHIASAVSDAIQSATGHNSAFRKQLKTAFEKNLPHGIECRDIPKFQQVLNHHVAAALNATHSAAAITAVQAAIDRAMPQVPEVLKLSELVQIVRTGLYDNDAVYAHMDGSDYSDDITNIYFDRDKSLSSKHRARYQIGVSKGEVFSMRIDSEKIHGESMPNVISNMESLFLSMYTGRTKLEIDMDSDELESSAGNRYEY